MQETQEMWVQYLDGEDPWEGDMATHDLRMFLEYWLTCFSYKQSPVELNRNVSGNQPLLPRSTAVLTLPWSCNLDSAPFQTHPWQSSKVISLRNSSGHHSLIKNSLWHPNSLARHSRPWNSVWTHMSSLTSSWSLFCSTFILPLSCSLLFQL